LSGREDIELEVRESEAKYVSKAKSLALSKRFILIDPNLKLWVYIGPKRDYILVEDLYCSCGSFTRSLLKKSGCIHLASVKIARETGKYRVLELTTNDIVGIIWDCVTVGYSLRLRRKL